MLSIVVVNQLSDWNFDIPDLEVISSRCYLTDTRYSELRNVRVYNLCRSHRYQGLGYYVSLLAEARGHRVFPCITTIQDIKSQTIMRVISDEVDEIIQKSFAKLKSEEFDLSVYFGQNVAKQYEKISKQLYNLFQVPLFKAHFVFNKKWILQNISPIPLNELPEHHKPYFIDFAQTYFSKKRIHPVKKTVSIYDLAILVNPEEKVPPSDKRAISLFTDAAESLGFRTKLITKDDFSRIPEFDALFIRETTSVNHHTYRFARRASAENMVVIDDPESILKCTNKVYLAELMNKFKIPIPQTMIVHKDNKTNVREQLGLPCVLKQPDGSFSNGVVKISDQETLEEELDKFINRSELIIAQEFIPTEFDWRIGILDKKPLYACKYYMAKNHWQIYNWHANKRSIVGNYETLDIKQVPPKVMEIALKAASLIGDGFYGVDLKQLEDDRVVVIEINDNPSIDHGVEDSVLTDKLYISIMQYFLEHINMKKNQQLLKK
ncbi:MAG: RimK family protein [Gammaproteobacteria bacterium]|nr:RimK family protein [Gammaproteobacteria bacterium]